MFKLDTAELKHSIKNLHKASVLVVGDFAIDEMIYANSHRISREAPILILKHSHTNIILGTAANATHNIATLNSGKVYAVGVQGDDYHGGILSNAMQKAGIDSSFMVKDNSRPTTTKTRISGFSAQSVTQQIARVDRESDSVISEEIEHKIIQNIIELTPKVDAVILSDYNLGVITPKVIKIAISEAKKHNKIIGVDAQKDLKRFKGATFITPNQPDTEKEVGYSITDKTSLDRAGQELLALVDTDFVLITRGNEGMELFEKGNEKKSFSIPAFNKTEVFDVTGAGDTVVAAFTLALASGATPFNSAVIGNIAASIAVRQFGCATTTKSELLNELENLIERTEITNA